MNRSLTAKIVLYIIFKQQSNHSGLYVNNVMYVQTAAWPQPEPQPEPQPDRSSLYINNGDVMQTAAVRTAAVCLGH